jgi:hypothetical protein
MLENRMLASSADRHLRRPGPRLYGSLFTAYKESRGV